MILSLDKDQFLTAAETTELERLGLYRGNQSADARRTIGALMLVPVMEIAAQDGATSPAEFEAAENYVRRIEHEFELASKEDLESVGTDMGLLPMIKATMDRLQLRSARRLLAEMLERMSEQDAHTIRNAIAKACLDMARAGSGHLINLHTVEANERPLILEIARDLKLETTSEGLHLVGEAG